MFRLWQRGLSISLALVLSLGSILALGHSHNVAPAAAHQGCGCAVAPPDGSAAPSSLIQSHDDCGWCGFLASLNAGATLRADAVHPAPLHLESLSCCASVDLPAVFLPTSSARGPPILG